MSNQIICIACGGSEDDACQAHIYEPVFLTTADSRHDYADIYYWPCCLDRTMGQISNESGTDIIPQRTGGCRTHKTHLLKANALIIYFDEDGKQIAEKVKQQSNDYDITIEIQSINGPILQIPHPSVYIVLFPTSAKDRHFLYEFEEISKAATVLYYGGNNESESFRYHVGSVQPMSIYKDLVLALARQHYGIDNIKYPFFASYSRKYESHTRELMDAIPKFDRWKDTVFLSSGVIWSKEIELAIKNSYLFICFLHKGISSKSYIWEEVRLAQLYNKPIIFAANDFDWNYLIENPELNTGEMIKSLDFLSITSFSESLSNTHGIFYFDANPIESILEEADSKGKLDSYTRPASILAAQIQVCLNSIFKKKAHQGDSFAKRQLKLNKKSHQFSIQKKTAETFERVLTSSNISKIIRKY